MCHLERLKFETTVDAFLLTSMEVYRHRITSGEKCKPEAEKKVLALVNLIFWIAFRIEIRLIVALLLATQIAVKKRGKNSKRMLCMGVGEATIDDGADGVDCNWYKK